MSMNNLVNTASVETSRFLVLFIMKLNGLIIKKHIVYACVSSKKTSFDNTNNYNNNHGDYFFNNEFKD